MFMERINMTVGQFSRYIISLRPVKILVAVKRIKEIVQVRGRQRSVPIFERVFILLPVIQSSSIREQWATAKRACSRLVWKGSRNWRLGYSKRSQWSVRTWHYTILEHGLYQLRPINLLTLPIIHDCDKAIDSPLFIYHGHIEFSKKWWQK